MKITDTLQGKIWTKTAMQLNGELSIKHQQLNGGSRTGGVYTFKISIQYKSVTIEISCGLEELSLKNDDIKSSVITITAKKKTTDEISLSIWRKDFLDKIFGSNKSKTEYKEFDKVIGLKASRNIERYLHKIFENVALRTELINDKYRTYNIKTINDEIVIQRKSGLRMNDSEMIVNEFNKFQLFVDGLINANII